MRAAIQASLGMLALLGGVVAGTIAARPTTPDVRVVQLIASWESLPQPPQATQVPKQNLSGVVRWQSQPVRNASVFLLGANPKETKTDADGIFSFEDAPSAPLALLAELPGAGRAFLLHPEAGASLELSLAPAPIVSGVVKDNKGRPVPNAEVLLIDEELGLSLQAGALRKRFPQTTARTNPDGVFRVEGLRPGLASIHISAENLASYQSEAIQLYPGTIQEHSFSLAQVRSVGVRVIDSKGTPIPGVELWLNFDDVVRTDAKGRATLRAPTDGTTILSASAEGYQPMMLSLAEKDQMELRLPRPANLTGELAGAPTNARLFLIPEGDTFAPSRTVPAHLVFRFEGLWPGKYHLWISEQGALRPLQEIVLEEGENTFNAAFTPTPSSQKATSCEEVFVPRLAVERRGGNLMIKESRYGLVEGDRIVAINGVALIASEEGAPLPRLEGPQGSEVMLSVERPSTHQILYFSLKREKKTGCQ